ncbi:MAG: sulfonate transport system substrate-binding protein [Thermoplasmata archaeon]|jgi:NitT/TauT family transport system substrate-binding protein|nr:sulfonate transport system substrate-binding protein [Thermoplasmata archaeon]
MTEPNCRATVVLALALVLAAAAGGCVGQAQEGVVRLGYFPNLTHAQALLGTATGSYQAALGDTKLETSVFNAGPSALEALLGGRVDVVYVGPSPTINAVEKAGLDKLVVIAGAASGGALFVLRDGVRLESDADYAGKTFATPQLGNTQDVALKHHLKEHGHTTTDQGGDVEVVNAQNPDIVSQFALGRIDGAWLPEPWASRLVLENGGQVFLDESDAWPGGRFVTAHIVTTRAFLASHRADLDRLLGAHQNATRQLQNATAATLDAVNRGIEIATGKRIGDAIVVAAMRNIVFTDDPLASTFERQYAMSNELGFVGPPPADLSRLWDLGLLRNP